MRRFGVALALFFAVTALGGQAVAEPEALPLPAPPVAPGPVRLEAIGEADNGSQVHMVVGGLADGALRADVGKVWSPVFSDDTTVVELVPNPGATSVRGTRLFRVHAVTQGEASLSAYETSDCGPNVDMCSPEPSRVFSVTVVVHGPVLTEADSESAITINAGDRVETLLTARPGMRWNVPQSSSPDVVSVNQVSVDGRWLGSVQAFDLSATGPGEADIWAVELPDCPPAAPCILIVGREFRLHVSVDGGDAPV